MRAKYPKTPHFPWSPGLKNDDTLFTGSFEGKAVVATEKMDGENTTLYKDGLHARSMDSRHHDSRNWIKNLHGSFKREIPEGYRLCGENLYAQHSIRYEELPSYFMLFSIWDDTNVCLPWSNVERVAEFLGIPTVPVLYQGVFDIQAIKSAWVSLPYDSEGYVVRVAEGFHYNQFHQNVAKYVRKNHIQTDEHWMSKAIVPNKLSSIP